MRFKSHSQRKAVMAKINNQQVQPYGRMETKTSNEIEKENLKEFQKKKELYTHKKCKDGHHSFVMDGGKAPLDTGTRTCLNCNTKTGIDPKFQKKKEYYRIQREISERKEKAENEEKKLKQQQEDLKRKEAEIKERNQRYLNNLKSNAKGLFKAGMKRLR